VFDGKSKQHPKDRSNDKKKTKALPFVVIDASVFGRGNSIPFKNVLRELKPAKGTKTRKGSFMYIFSATHDGTTYWKVGNTGDASTYHSKNRFAAMLEYNGYLQVLQYGTLFERLLHCYFTENYKSTEWYVHCDERLEALVGALRTNEHFQEERPLDMVNILPFEMAFTGRYGSHIDDYLSLFRVRDEHGRLYRLTEATVDKSVTHMMCKEALDVLSTEAALQQHQPAAPAPPTTLAVASSSTKKN
jgi:hypothetical protein